MNFDQSKEISFYEQHTYPFRPQGTIDDNKLIGIPSNLRFINHYVFGGRRDFKEPFRVLIAGVKVDDIKTTRVLLNSISNSNWRQKKRFFVKQIASPMWKSLIGI